jgi:hypothetical protein
MSSEVFTFSSVGRLFTSFDEAWEYFLGRAEPLEWFFGDFPEDEGFAAVGWVIEPPGEIKQAALELQATFASLEWLAPIPEHFLHVWLGGGCRWLGVLRSCATAERSKPCTETLTASTLLWLSR